MSPKQKIGLLINDDTNKETIRKIFQTLVRKFKINK